VVAASFGNGIKAFCYEHKSNSRLFHVKSRALEEQPFHFQALKNDRLQIFHKGRLAITLTARRAIQTLQKLERADEHNAQLIMAKATGQFKFGNEKAVKER
jgi:hypothetical protein